MSKNGRICWGRRFLEALETFMEPSRLARGKTYLSGVRVNRWEIRDTRVLATVRGRVSAYFGVYEEPLYQVEVELQPIPDALWQDVIRHIGEKVGLLARLLVNDIPDAITAPLAAAGHDLLPRQRRDLRGHCSCPDREYPCGHLAGVLHLLAARIDLDPLLLFGLRGLPRTAVAERLRATPLGAALSAALTEDSGELLATDSFFARPLPVSLPEGVEPRQFWRGDGRLPPGVELPQPAVVSGILVRKGGDYPPFWDKEQSFVEAMDAFYENVRKKSKEWL